MSADRREERELAVEPSHVTAMVFRQVTRARSAALT
jgi:hypothetical protein